jgi:hypothetical protein
MTRALATLALILAAGALSAAPAETEPDAGFGIGPSARFFFAPLRGHAESDKDLSYGTSVDLRDDLGMSGTSPFVELGVVAGWWEQMGGRRFTYGFEVRGMWGDWEGESTLHEPTVFDGSSFPVGSTVKSTFATDLTLINGTCSWQFEMESVTSQVGFFMGIGILGASLEMDGPSGRETDSLRQVPFGGGVRASVSPWPWLDAGIEAGYYFMYYDIVDWDWNEYEEHTQVVDLSARVGVKPWKYAAIEVGYRFLSVDMYERFEDDDYWITGDREKTEFTWVMQGWFVGGTIRF